MNANVEALRGRRILLVEDEYFLADDMVRDFESSGAVIAGPVATVDDALRLIRAHSKLDGAVLDINIHGEKVYPVADLLAERGIPFVFSTGYEDSVIPARYSDARRCRKPVEPHAVARALFSRNPD